MATSLRDIIETLVPLFVQPGVQEAKRSFATGDERIIDKRENASSQRRGRRRPTDGTLSSVPDIGEVQALRREIRVRTAV